MKLFIVGMAVLVGIVSTAQGASPDLKALAGEYHVLQYNDDHSPTGKLLVRADSVFGFELLPLNFPDKKSPQSNVPATELVSPAAVTVVTKEGVLVKQVAQVGKRKIEIRYENYGDFMIIQGTDCNEGCAATKITVGKVGSFGSTMTSTEFLKEVKGTYLNATAGGIPFKESTKELTVEPDFDTGKGFIAAPYCDKNETFCDGGMLIFSEAKTKVWHRNLGGGHHIYDIFASEGGFGMASAGYYRWEEIPVAKGKEIHFRNMQYLLPNGGGKVCMEHITQPM